MDLGYCSYRREGKKLVNLIKKFKKLEMLMYLFTVIRVTCQSSEHYFSPLRVTDIIEALLTGNVQDRVYHGREVVFSHLIPRESPVISFGVRSYLLVRVDITSYITHPNVKAGIGKDKSGRLRGKISHPIGRRSN